jgi:hypothetical protein
MRSHNGATEKHKIHNIDLRTTRIGGDCQSHSRMPLRLHRHHLLLQHDEEGVVHPLDYEIVEVTCIKLFLVPR